MDKYIIEEHRFEDKTSQFVLKRKVWFWWEKVPMHPYYTSNPYAFVKLASGIEYINRNRGDLIAINLKEEKTKKKK